VRRKDGQFAWFLSHNTVFERDHDGAVIRHIDNASDITRQKASEERALVESRQATTANDDLRAFAYSVSHDMRTPSNTVLMLLSEVQAVHSHEIPEDARYLIDLAKDSVRRTQTKIEYVLDLTRLLDRDDERSAVPLDDILQVVRQDLKAEIKESSGSLTAAALPVVSASHSQMCTLFQNLISNALKYRSQACAPKVEIWDSSSSTNDDHVEITVRDNGIGIPADDRKQIFEMFRRLHLQSEYEGNGLGLANCRRIATGHDGEIWVTAAPERGSDFKVRLKR